MTQDNVPRHIATMPLRQRRRWCSKHSFTLQAGRTHWRAGHELRTGSCGTLPTTDSDGHHNRPARDSTFDNDQVEDHLTHGFGVEADRPQSSSSAGSGSDSRPTARIRADPPLPRGVVRIGNNDASAPEQEPDM